MDYVLKSSILNKKYLKNNPDILHYAVQNYKAGDKITVITLLLENGANIDILNKNYESSLYIASTKSAELVKLLCRYGANVNLQNKYGNTALHNAAENNCWDNIKILLSYGADINLRNKKGYTILKYFQTHNSLERIVLLLQYDMRINIQYLYDCAQKKAICINFLNAKN